MSMNRPVPLAVLNLKFCRLTACATTTREDFTGEARRQLLLVSSGGEEPVSDDGFSGNSIFWLGQVDKPFTANRIHRLMKKDVEMNFPQEPRLGGLLSAGHTPGGDFLFRKN